MKSDEILMTAAGLFLVAFLIWGFRRYDVAAIVFGDEDAPPSDPLNLKPMTRPAPSPFMFSAALQPRMTLKSVSPAGRKLGVIFL